MFRLPLYLDEVLQTVLHAGILQYFIGRYTSPAETHNEVLDVIMASFSLIYPLCFEEGESLCYRAENLTSSFLSLFSAVYQSLSSLLANPPVGSES